MSRQTSDDHPSSPPAPRTVRPFAVSAPGPSSIPFPQFSSSAYGFIFPDSHVPYGSLVPHVTGVSTSHHAMSSQHILPRPAPSYNPPLFHPLPRDPLSHDATNVPGEPSAAPTPARKRRNATSGRGGASRKRARVPATLDKGPISTQCGVGPSILSPHPADMGANHLLLQPGVPDSLPTSAPFTQLPTTSYASLRSNRKPRLHGTSATDVYYFCRAVDSEERPGSSYLLLPKSRF